MYNRSALGQDKHSTSIRHDEWVRKKEHETKLREQLILEAKKDLLEQIRKRQQD